MSIENLLKASPEQILEMKKSLKKTDEEINKDVQRLREWLLKQPHIPKIKDDLFLAKFLIINKFSLEKSKQKIDAYYSMPHFIPELFKNREPLNPKIQKILNLTAVIPLPQLTADFGRVSIMKLLRDDVDLDVNDFFKLIFVIADIRIQYDYCIHDHLIIDLSNVRISHMKTVNPMMIKNMINVVQRSYSDRIGGLHYINAPSFAGKIINIIKSIVKEKLIVRIYIHKDLESLYQHVPQNVLPSDYNGSERSINELHADWKQYLASQNSWFLNLDNRLSNEELRIGTPLNCEMMGLQGSFRTLSVD